jgi:hypothetical protein
VNTWANPIYAKAARHAETLTRQTDLAPTKRILRNAHDGSIMSDEDFFPNIAKDDPERRYCTLLIMCSDGAEWKKNQTFTPLLAMVADWKLDMRNAQGAMWVLGVLPGHVQNYQSMHLPNARQLAECGPDGVGVPIVDAHDGTHHLAYVAVAFFINDLRGYYNATMGKKPPCNIGACCMCGIKVRSPH